MYIDLHVKYPSFLLDFNGTWIFVDGFLQNIQKSNLTKIRPEGAELFHADGQTDRSKLTVVFRNFTHLKITLFAE